MNAELLGVLLHTLEKAPVGWAAEAFAVRHPAPDDDDDSDSGDAADRAYSQLAEVLGDELLVALRRAATRAATPKLVSMLACVDRACRAEADKFAPAEARAARVAHAQAMHDMARALLSGHHGYTRSEAAALLVSWCRADNAGTALNGRYDNEASAADKWRVFACEFARAVAKVRRVWRLRVKAALRNEAALLHVLAAQPAPPPPLAPDHLELLQLASQDEESGMMQLLTLEAEGA